MIRGSGDGQPRKRIRLRPPKRGWLRGAKHLASAAMLLGSVEIRPAVTFLERIAEERAQRAIELNEEKLQARGAGFTDTKQ